MNCLSSTRHEFREYIKYFKNVLKFPSWAYTQQVQKCYEKCLNNFQRTEIIYSIFSNHNCIYLEINSRKIYGYVSNIPINHLQKNSKETKL